MITDQFTQAEISFNKPECQWYGTLFYKNHVAYAVHVYAYDAYHQDIATYLKGVFGDRYDQLKFKRKKYGHFIGRIPNV